MVSGEFLFGVDVRYGPFGDGRGDACGDGGVAAVELGVAFGGDFVEEGGSQPGEEDGGGAADEVVDGHS